MAKIFQISTTGATSPVIINDLGARSFTHPIVSLDLTDEYTLEEIRDSEDLKAAIVAGDITANFDTQVITDAATFDAALVDFDTTQTQGNTTDILILQGQIASLQEGGRLSEVLAYVDNTAVPPTEVLGDRYIIDDTGASNAAWDGAPALALVEFDGAVWVAQTVESGNVVYVIGENLDRLYVDDGSPAWEARNGAFNQTAIQVPYSPTTPGDWDVTPTEVGGALDEAANRIETLENAVTTPKKQWSWSVGDDNRLNGSRDLKRAGGPETNLTPFRATYTGTLHAIEVQSADGVSETYDVEVIINGVTQHTESVAASDGAESNGLSIAVTKGDKVRIRFIKTSGNIRDLGVVVYGIES